MKIDGQCLYVNAVLMISSSSYNRPFFVVNVVIIFKFRICESFARINTRLCVQPWKVYWYICSLWISNNIYFRKCLSWVTAIKCKVEFFLKYRSFWACYYFLYRMVFKSVDLYNLGMSDYLKPIIIFIFKWFKETSHMVIAGIQKFQNIDYSVSHIYSRFHGLELCEYFNLC